MSKKRKKLAAWSLSFILELKTLRKAYMLLWVFMDSIASIQESQENDYGGVIDVQATIREGSR
jgi:flagellar biosynthesis regulator FlaF